MVNTKMDQIKWLECIEVNKNSVQHIYCVNDKTDHYDKY